MRRLGLFISSFKNIPSWMVAGGLAVGLLAGSFAAAAPLNYRIEFLDEAVLGAPSEALPQGGSLCWPFAATISANGRYVVTYVCDNADSSHLVPVRLDRSNGMVTHIPDLASYSSLARYQVNNQGNLVVDQRIGLSIEVVFWSEDTGPIPFGEMSLLPRFGATPIRVLNDNDEVLVQAGTQRDLGFLWNPRADIRTLIDDNSLIFVDPKSLNNRGQIVGIAVVRNFPDPFEQHAFIWERDTGITLLEDLNLIYPNGNRIAGAYGINDDGMIVGQTQGPGLGQFGLVWPDAGSAPVALGCGEIMGTPIIDCAALWINQSGFVVGGGLFADGEPEISYVWDGLNPYVLPELLPPMSSGVIVALADTGELAGLALTGIGTPEFQFGPALFIPIQSDSEPPLVSDLVSDPNPAPVYTPVLLTVDVDDGTTGDSDIVSATYSIDGGAPVDMAAEDGAFDSSLETASAVIPGIATPGVYEICVTAEDAAGNVSGPVCTLLAVYDPNAGFVTGGGWIDSPAGAYWADATPTGKAKFGFVARYQKGASTPSGTTEFQFQAGDLNFHSSSYEWLVVSGVDKTAHFKGLGTINGQTDSEGNLYPFMLWAGDGEPDTFRIRIWWEANGAETDVYDNGTSPLGGGSIVIHQGTR